MLLLDQAVQEAVPGLLETVPAFNKLLILGQARDWDRARVAALVEPLARACLVADPEPSTGKPVTLPTCYDPGLAPDLESLAAGAGLTVAELADLHSGIAYVVLATGFAPGFPYLGDVDARLEAPRHPSPRPRVEAGSVGIADRRTGVYPSAGPGGWQLIARVPPPLFADATQRIARFEPGATVRFRPIDLRAYQAEGG